MSAERNCPRCGDVFVPEQPNQQVCTKEHFKQCVVCGKNFPWDKRKKTCSTICTAALRQSSQKERNCAYCGESFKPGNHKAMYCHRDHYSQCVVCKKDFIIADIHRISKTCSTSCAATLSHTDSAKQKRIENNLKKHGVEHTFQADAVKEKIKTALDTDPAKDYRIGSESFKKLIKDEYGVENVSSLDDVKCKKIAVSMEKYGTTNPFQAKEVQEKFKKTVSEKYENKWINQLHIENFDEYKDMKRWAIMFEKNNGKKPSIGNAATYFNVSPVAISVVKQKENLSAYFRIINSKKEEKFQTFLADNFADVHYKHNDRTAIAPQELDFYFPKHNFAVEISPTSSHHSSSALINYGKNSPKEETYHLDKALACEEAGIELFTIFDWMPWEKSLNMVRHKLLGSERRIYARKAEVHFIDKYVSSNKKVAQEIKKFIDETHVLGFDGRGSQYFTYLTYDDEIIAAAAWGKPRNLSIKSLGKKHGTDVVELTRMCFKPGVSVPGGASRLLKTFTKNYSHRLKSIMTFSDYDLGFGNIYETLGFEMIETPVAQKNYVHPVMMKGDDGNEHNFRIKSSSLHFAGADRLLKNFPDYVPVGMECQHEGKPHRKGSCLPSNSEIVESYGFVPVYDCGYKKWLLNLEKEVH